MSSGKSKVSIVEKGRRENRGWICFEKECLETGFPGNCNHSDLVNIKRFLGRNLERIESYILENYCGCLFTEHPVQLL